MIEIGKTYEVRCPFIRDVYTGYDQDGPSTSLTWRPGVMWESHEYGSYAYAHGVGKVVYRVVDVTKLPRPYPPRVFYVRTWADPDGRQFGNKCLRIMTVEAFVRRIKGYHCGGTDGPDDFEVEDLGEYDRAQLLERRP